MFRLRKRTRLGLAAMLVVSLALMVSCLTLGSTFAGAFRKRLEAASRSPEIVHKPVLINKLMDSASTDGDRDGFPDAAELRTFADRQSFRNAFTAIAELQFYRLSDQWNPEQHDCAGLVRFAWREALRRHDRAWFQKMGPGYEVIAPTSGLNDNPLGEKLFRTDFGTYKDTDLRERSFSEFADARTLKNFNSTFVSRDRELAQPGDLFFYYQPWVQKFPYHVMIFLGESQVAEDNSRDWVVYHTGASLTDPGTVKKVNLCILDRHPNKRWRPVESNPNFLGFYRLKILD